MARKRSRNLGLAAGLLAAASYYFIIRPWQQKWGVGPSEVHKIYPGDELVPQPDMQTTRAVTIKAPADKVWPWVVQIGYQRGGFYSYDFIEEKAGLGGIRSAGEIVPDWQALQPGDQVLISPVTPLDVAVLEPNRALVLHIIMNPFTGQPVSPGIPLPAAYFDGSWSLILDTPAPNITRLIARLRAAYRPQALLTPLVVTVLEPAHFLMERKMLLNIKERVESAEPW